MTEETPRRVIIDGTVYVPAVPADGDDRAEPGDFIALLDAADLDDPFGLGHEDG